jgi:ABC-type multidrug transport system ATPase subunit
MSDTNVIRLQNVNKSFGRQPVLKQLNLNVPEHSVYAFLGNNGEGKSTTIRLLTGLMRADEGQIEVLGLDVAKNKQKILQQVGTIVDSPALYPQLTAAEFLRIGCLLKGLAKSEIARILDTVGLTKVANQKIKTFSLGMKQRLALAHALLGTPKLLILDEPTNGLDPQGMLEIRELIKALPQTANCTVFLSSHLLDEVEKMATHVALLKHGSVQVESSIAQIKQNNTGTLRLDVCNATKAAQTLGAMGYQVTEHSPTALAVNDISDEGTDKINARLINSGLRLFQSVYHQPSLEEWFLNATNKSKAI